jgi:hypothetical protein
MSFSGAGITLALDFPWRAETLAYLPRLDAVVTACGGRMYPAKDARMSGETFRLSYPAWEEFAGFVDPRFSSSFWRRMNAG